MEQVTRAEGAFRHCQVNNWNSTNWQETNFNLWHKMHRMGYSYWAIETKRTDTGDKTNGFSRNYGAKDQRSLGWGHQGRGFAAGGCSVPQPLTHGKDTGLKKAYWGETTNNFHPALSSTMPWPSHPRSCIASCNAAWTCIHISRFSKLTETTWFWAEGFFLFWKFHSAVLSVAAFQKHELLSAKDWIISTATCHCWVQLTSFTHSNSKTHILLCSTKYFFRTRCVTDRVYRLKNPQTNTHSALPGEVWHVMSLSHASYSKQTQRTRAKLEQKLLDAGTSPIHDWNL